MAVAAPRLRVLHPNLSRRRGSNRTVTMLLEQTRTTTRSAQQDQQLHPQHQQRVDRVLQKLYQDTSSEESQVMLTRDFISKSLYNRHNGYFSTKDVINHMPGALDFGGMLGELHYRVAVKQVRVRSCCLYCLSFVVYWVQVIFFCGLG